MIKPYFRLVVAVVTSKNEFDVIVELIVPDAVGVPILGVTNVGEVARTKEPVPVPVAKVKTGVVVPVATTISLLAEVTLVTVPLPVPAPISDLNSDGVL